MQTLQIFLNDTINEARDGLSNPKDTWSLSIASQLIALGNSEVAKATRQNKKRGSTRREY